MRKEISTSEMQAYFPVMSESTMRDYNEELENFNKFKSLWPDAEILHTVESGYEFSTIYVNKEKTISTNFNWTTKGKWDFCLEGLNKFPRHNYSDTEKAHRLTREEGIEKPQYMGVLSENKISAWVNYYSKVRAHIDEILQEKENKISIFRESIKDLTEANGYKVIIHPAKDRSSSERGYFTKGGIQLEYTINVNGFIDQKISIIAAYNEDTVKLFTELSDNGYKK